MDASRAGTVIKKKQIERHDVAEVILETRQPIAFDTIQTHEATARFVIVDGYEISGGGIILSAESDDQETYHDEARIRNFNWIKDGVSAESRAKQWGNPAVLIMVVGQSGTGKHRQARALEKAMFD